MWNDYMRIEAFDIANKYKEKINQINCRDINGFVDKDTEAALIRYAALISKKEI